MSISAPMPDPRAPACLLLLAAATVAAAPVAQREPSLDEVLERAAAYAVRYGETMASVIAAEDYVQEVDAADGTVLERRRLSSEIAVVQLTGSAEWQSFRDVLTVDDTPVASGPGRLERIFRQAPATVLGQVRALAADSARFNLGPLQRTFNTPTIMLQFLHPAHQDRFTFKRQKTTTCDGTPCWEISVKEQRTGTLIRTAEGRNVPIDATLWLTPADGRLMRGVFRLTEFIQGSKGARPRAEIQVDWRADTNVDGWVPAVMRERYEGLPPDPTHRSPGSLTVKGTATYSDYRRFVVDYRIR